MLGPSWIIWGESYSRENTSTYRPPWSLSRSLWLDPGFWEGILDNPATEQLYHHGNLLWRAHCLRTPSWQRKSRWDHKLNNNSSKVSTKKVTENNIKKLQYQKQQICWPEILSRESIQDQIQPRLEALSITKDPNSSIREIKPYYQPGTLKAKDQVKVRKCVNPE